MYDIDLKPLKREDLRKDSNIIFVGPESNPETRHSVNNNILTIETLAPYSDELNAFLTKLGDWLKSLNTGEIFKIDKPITRLDSFLNQIKFIIDNKLYLEQLSTRKRLIVLAQTMALCYGSLLEPFRTRYELLIPEGWQIFPLFAYLIDYNYVRDEENSIEYPVHHKLIISMLEQYFSKDIPAIYETLCQISDIEQLKANNQYQLKSIFYLKNPLELNAILDNYNDLSQFKDKIKVLRLTCNINNIVRTCEIADNYYSLKTILELITRAKSHDIKRSNKEKQALLGSLIQIGEYVKHLSAPLRQNTPHIPWQFYKDLRDYLEHPDEKGRCFIIQNLLDDKMASQSITLSKLQKELDILENEILETLNKFYSTPGISFLKDKDKSDGLFMPPKDNFSLSNELKISGKDKRKFYNLKLGSDDHWRAIISGQICLTDADIDVLKNAKHANPTLAKTIDIIFNINDALLEHQKIAKWSMNFLIPNDKLKKFLELSEQINERDFWISVLNGQQISISKDKIDDTIKSITTLDSTKIMLFSEIISKIQPICIQSLILVFNTYKKDDLDNLGILTQVVFYLDLAQTAVHDKLHNDIFIKEVLSKAEKYRIENHHNACQKLNPKSLNFMKEFQKKYPTPEQLTEEEFDNAMQEYIDSGLYEYFEHEHKLSFEQNQELSNDFLKKYTSEISELLQSDTTFCDELQHYFTVIFALIKKLLEQKDLIDSQIIPMLEFLKRVRNFLAHQDDYISKIVKAESYIHVELLGKYTNNLYSYFELLEKKLRAGIEEPALEVIDRVDKNRKQRLSKFTESPNRYLFWTKVVTVTIVGGAIAIANKDEIKNWISESCRMQ